MDGIISTSFKSMGEHENSDSRRRRVCLDQTKCSVGSDHSYDILTIERGARVISNTRHLFLGALPYGTSAVQYKTKKKVRLIVCRVHSKDTRIVFLKRIARQAHPISETDVRRATRLCERAGTDGWFVDGDLQRRLTECLVLLYPKQVLS